MRSRILRNSELAPFLTLHRRNSYARERMRRTLRRLLIAFLILAALILIAYQSRHKVNLADFTWSRFIHSVSQANLWLLLLSVVAIYVCYAIRAMRWDRFCRYVGPTRFWNTYSATVMGFAAIFVLGRAGEPVRPLLLARKDRLPVSSMFGIYFLERFFDFASAVGMVCLSLLVFSRSLSAAGADMGWVDRAAEGAWLLFAALLILIAFLVYYRVHGAGAVDRCLTRWHTRGGWRTRIATAIAGFSEGLQAIRTLPDLAAAIAYSALHWGLVAAAFLWITHAFPDAFVHSDMTFPGAMLLLAVTIVGSALQLPGVGGGAQIASFIGLTKIFGVVPEPAIAIAVVLWIVTFAAAGLAGIPLLIHEGVSMADLRTLARAEAQAEEAGLHVSVPAGGQVETLSGKKEGESAR